MTNELEYPSLASHLIAIVEKYAGLPAEYGSHLDHELDLDSRARQWIIEECFVEFCSHINLSDADFDFAEDLDTVEELIQYFEELADCSPTNQMNPPKKDFHFRF